MYWGKLNMVQHFPEFKRKNQHNQKRNMSKQASIFKLIGRLARIVLVMVHKGDKYRMEEGSQITA